MLCCYVTDTENLGTAVTGDSIYGNKERQLSLAKDLGLGVLLQCFPDVWNCENIPDFEQNGSLYILFSVEASH